MPTGAGDCRGWESRKGSSSAEPDPWAYAYSAPENAALFLILPALFIAGLALTGRRRAVAETSA
ncbi:MAG: hypothetical protein ACXWMG_02915 [Candidatus Limnocylindria bacterium]